MASKRTFPQGSEEEEGDRSLVRGPKRSPLWSRCYREVTAERFMERLFPQLERLLRRVVQEEVQKLLVNYAYPVPRPLTNRIQEVVRFRLHFQGRLPDKLFTGRKIEVGDKMPFQVVIKYANSDDIITSGPMSSIKIKIVVLNADFGGDEQEDWTLEEFVSHIVSERDGRRPLLKGGLSIRLSKGVGCIVGASFTDNSSWTRSGKFRLGAVVSESRCPEGRVQEAISEAFKVKDGRVESNQKDGPPSLNDEVWCLKKIAKDGAFHEKLVSAGINTVQEFLRSFILDPRSLRNLLGRGMSNKMWGETLKHASGCTLGNKLYSYCFVEHGLVLVFNSIFELLGAKIGGNYHPLVDLTASQKNLVDHLKELAYKNHGNIVEFYDTLADSFPRPIHTMDITAIPGSSLSDPQIPNPPATCHGEPSIPVGLQHQPYAPHNELLDDISACYGSDSVHQLLSFLNRDSIGVSVEADNTLTSFLMPQSPTNAITFPGSSSSSQLPDLPATLHAAAPVGFEHQLCEPFTVLSGDHWFQLPTAPFLTDSISTSFGTGEQSMGTGTPLSADIKAWVEGLMAPDDETSTDFGSVPLYPHKWAQLIGVLKWVSVIKLKRSAARRARSVHTSQ